MNLLNQDWFLWSIALLVLFPLLFVVFGEVTQTINRDAGARTRLNSYSAYAAPVAWLRTSCLPLLFIVLLLRKVIGLDGEHLAVRIADTAFWIVLINFALAVINVAFFGAGEIGGLRTRVPKLLLDLLRFALVLVATAVVISTVWGIDLGGLLTALGVGSLVIGLALQDTLGAVFSGIAMISSRQFRVGDRIQVGETLGTLINMNWRTATIRTLAGDDVVVPNAFISRERVTVIGGGSSLQNVIITFDIAYGHSPDKVIALLIATAKASKGVTGDPFATIASYEPQAIRYLVFLRDKFETTGTAKHEFLCNFWYAARRAGIIMPGQYHRDFEIPEAGHWPLDVKPETLAKLVADTGALRIVTEGLAAADGLLPLVKSASQQIFRNQETLILSGAPLRHVYVVIEGKVQALYSPESGKEIVIHEFERGQLVVFKSLFRTGESPFTLRANEELTVVAIPASDFKAYLGHDQAITEDIEKSLSANQQAASRAIEQAFPGQFGPNGSADRVQYLRELFRV